MISERDDTDGAGRFPENNPGKPMFLLGVAAMLAFGWLVFPLTFYRSVDQPLQFNHKIHTADDIALKCTACHNYDADGRFCGIPATATCVGCHAKRIATSGEEEKLLRYYIKPHKEILWVAYSRQPANVYFSHATHVNLAKLECQSCHFGHAYTESLRPARFSRLSGYSLDIFGKTLLNAPSTTSLGMRMDDCTDCHRKSGIKESCIDCHK